MKKLLLQTKIILFVAISLFLLMPNHSYANEYKVDKIQLMNVNQWKYRYVNGRLQRRLWSITNNKWLTNWQWVN